MNTQAVADKLAHAYVRLMRHPETCLYAGVMQIGKREVVDNTPTACTDGINVKYGAAFFADRPVDECSAVVLHETLHKVFKHCTRHREFWKEDADLANQAADYVVNDVIVQIEDKALCRLPDGALIDPMFSGWSFAEVYNYLRKEKKDNGGRGREGTSLDSHEPNDEMSEAEIQQVAKDIDDEIKQGGVLAGRLGKKLPRSIDEACTAKVDWTVQMQEYLSTASTGKDDDYSYRRIDKRWLLDDIIAPATHNEVVGETVLAIDTSGSIDSKILTQFAEEIALYAQSVSPESIRVLWWDAAVHAEQVFTPDQYGSIKTLLKPVGGGGTRLGCVSKYINDKRLKPDVVVVLTDGYVESEYDWDIKSPTLWLVTERRGFNPKCGRLIRVD